MGIAQIGARLIRSFGSGENLRKVVTEFRNGKTYTRVLDADGKVLQDRVKQIVRGQQVGNKKVNTITKVYKGSAIRTEKSVTDRVYSKSGEFLGFREVIYDFYDGQFAKGFVKKSRVGSNTFSKSIYANGRVGYKNYGNVVYNEKGLPMPQWAKYGDVKGMSLKEMRDLHMKTHPEMSYARKGLGLDFLDKPTEGLAAMNDLDKFI